MSQAPWNTLKALAEAHDWHLVGFMHGHNDVTVALRLYDDSAAGLTVIRERGEPQAAATRLLKRLRRMGYVPEAPADRQKAG